MGQLKTAHIPC